MRIKTLPLCRVPFFDLSPNHALNLANQYVVFYGYNMQTSNWLADSQGMTRYRTNKRCTISGDPVWNQNTEQRTKEECRAADVKPVHQLSNREFAALLSFVD
jgi:hypothetical protein